MTESNQPGYEHGYYVAPASGVARGKRIVVKGDKIVRLTVKPSDKNIVNRYGAMLTQDDGGKARGFWHPGG